MTETTPSTEEDTRAKTGKNPLQGLVLQKSNQGKKGSVTSGSPDDKQQNEGTGELLC